MKDAMMMQSCLAQGNAVGLCWIYLWADPLGRDALGCRTLNCNRRICNFCIDDDDDDMLILYYYHIKFV